MAHETFFICSRCPRLRGCPCPTLHTGPCRAYSPSRTILVTAEEIATELRSHGFDVDLASDGSNGLALARAGDYAVITLDRMLPGIDGLALVTTLRREGITTPVLISALSDVDERVRGLRAGGDDYLTKPFASDEMAARVEVLIRRQGQAGHRQRTARRRPGTGPDDPFGATRRA
jgi:DNA-binding response OmpR family regulator